MDTEVNRGTTTFLRAIDSIEQLEQWWLEHPKAIGIAFVGRSNVGKSSLINALFGNKIAKTSKTPGRTQKINIFSFKLLADESRTFYFYDLPGYGYAQVNRSMSKNWKELMEGFFSTLNGRTLLINLQDARHPDQKTDQQLYQYLNPKYIEIFLVFNKLDKLKKQKERAALNKLKPHLFKSYKFVKQIFFVSAEKKDGVLPLEQAFVSYLNRVYDSDQQFES